MKFYQVCINVPVFMDENTIDPYEAEKSLLHGAKQEIQSRYRNEFSNNNYR